MLYNINLREEVFGGTVFNLISGKREYINKTELNDIISSGIFPIKSVTNSLSSNYKIKYTPIDNDNPSTNGFSFADTAFIELTRACNLRCSHCLNSSGNTSKNQLSFDEFLILIDNLADAGLQEIRFTGGEPLLFDKIYDLINFATKKGIYTSLGTNATLITASIAQKLRLAGLKKAIVSIDGTLEQHDIIRGKGNYKKTIDGLAHLTKHKIDARVNSVLMRSNMENVIDLAKEMHKNKTLLFIRRFIESGRGTELKDNMLTVQDYNYVREKLSRELADGPYVNGHYLRNNEGTSSRIFIPFEIKGCKAGQRALAIMPNGDINLCGFLAAQNFPASGNIRKIQNWRRFWNNLQQHNHLTTLCRNLEKYNQTPNIQTTYCLAYVQRFLNQGSKKC
ncbi:MAG: radical SAM protein [Lactobacillales bacterium]|jgi:MoaA/NifB/PqqE/SkfB family radical SAM enzyme|nr:radical SAM protein [Lactobacillales bacterium]